MLAQVRALTVQNKDEVVRFKGYERKTEAPPPAGSAIFVLVSPYIVFLRACSTRVPGSAASSCCRMGGESYLLRAQC